MKFQLNIEIDETQAKMSNMDLVYRVIDAVSNSLEELDSYYDVGVALDSIVSGLTN